MAGFWDGYWKSLKSREIEETIDVWVHRPLAYLLAVAAYPTPVSPNFITLVSIFFGIGAGICFVWPFDYHVQIGGVLLFWSAVWDCADGQLARMRGTASPFGRMLDGVADLVVSICGMGGAAYLVWLELRDPWWVGVIAILFAIITVITSTHHTASYDLYKNIYLRMTLPGYKEAEDYEVAAARFAAQEIPKGIMAAAIHRLAWYMYLFYLKEQRSRSRRFDPALPDFSDFPAYHEQLAERYRARALPMMRLWRGWFGFGSLVFGVSLFCLFDGVVWYLLLRLFVLNGCYIFYMRPRQRRLTQELIAEGILPPAEPRSL